MLLASVNAHGQDIPEVRFNHLSITIASKDLRALQESHFLKDSLAAFETRTTKVDGQSSYTATYLYGQSNYLEFFESSEDNSYLGFSTIVFSIDRIGGLNILKSALTKSSFKGTINGRERQFDGIKIPWYDALGINDTTLIDSAYLAQTHFWLWVMEYKTDYFEYNNFKIDDSELTVENYLEQYTAERKNKIVKRFSGIVMKLNVNEKEFITRFFDIINYRKLNENEYLSPDNFKYLIRDRHADDQFAVGSIMFETSRNFSSRKTVKISENIEVVIVGDEGQIFFNK